MLPEDIEPEDVEPPAPEVVVPVVVDVLPGVLVAPVEEVSGTVVGVAFWARTMADEAVSMAATAPASAQLRVMFFVCMGKYAPFHKMARQSHGVGVVRLLIPLNTIK